MWGRPQTPAPRQAAGLLIGQCPRHGGEMEWPIGSALCFVREVCRSFGNQHEPTIRWPQSRKRKRGGMVLLSLPLVHAVLSPES